MPLYRTRYHTGSQSVTTQCYARSREHLVETMRLRGMGEREEKGDGFFVIAPPTPPQMPSALLAREEYAAAHHALTWVSMIAVKAGVIDGWDLLHDDGLLHEMAHICHLREMGGRDAQALYDAKTLLPKIVAFEHSVPGVHPDWGRVEERAAAREVLARFEANIPSLAALAEQYGAFARVMQFARNYGPIHDEVQIDLMVDHYLPYLRPEKRAKPGTKAFARQQREHGQRERLAGKADLLSRMKTLRVPPQQSEQVTLTMRGVDGEVREVALPHRGGDVLPAAQFRQINKGIDLPPLASVTGRQPSDSRAMRFASLAGDGRIHDIPHDGPVFEGLQKLVDATPITEVKTATLATLDYATLEKRFLAIAEAGYRTYDTALVGP